LKRLTDAEIGRFRQENTLPERFILALGTIEPRKNLATLIRAFERLPSSCADVGLVIAGSQGWLSGDAVHAFRNSRIRERIRFIGDIRPADRAAWLSAASVLAYPSFFEGFGFPPLEAMACGPPALVGANSSMLEICGSAALPVQPYSVVQVRHGLHMLLADTALRERLIERGNVRAGQLSWQTTAEHTLEAILSTFS
jgi:glycosyltransferase involved in cell wall biosynthesis